jgi:CheY-like chemotaxis protein
MTSNPIHILLVEDNLTTLRASEKLLRKDGYIVYIAEGYQTALEVAKKERVDLIISDINLWDGDGCDLLRELHQLQPMQAIAVTGYTLPDEAEHYRAAGFAIVIRKPAHHSEISSSIANLTFARSTNGSPGEKLAK